MKNPPTFGVEDPFRPLPMEVLLVKKSTSLCGEYICISCLIFDEILNKGLLDLNPRNVFH